MPFSFIPKSTLHFIHHNGTKDTTKDRIDLRFRANSNGQRRRRSSTSSEFRHVLRAVVVLFPLAISLTAMLSGFGESCTRTASIKKSSMLLLTPRSHLWLAISCLFFLAHTTFLSGVVALRIERSATCLSDAFERPALDYLCDLQQLTPCGGFEPALCGLKGRHPQANRRTGLVNSCLLRFSESLKVRVPCAQCGLKRVQGSGFRSNA